MGAGEIVRYVSRYGEGRIARIVLIAPTTPFLLRTADNADGVDKKHFDELRKVTSTGVPKTVVVLRNERIPSPVASRKGTATPACLYFPIRHICHQSLQDSCSVPSTNQQVSDLHSPQSGDGDALRDVHAIG
jgi:hypothetical protein